MLDYRTYTGIGSRMTPLDIIGLMSTLGYFLANEGWILRSGCAPGADTAFEAGALAALKQEGVARPELYLPWDGFEGRERGRVMRTEPQEEAFEIAAEYHPAWGNLTQGARRLHARNVHQILGHDVTNPHVSTFIICWTKDGKGGGGTGQALRIAKGYNVAEIYDLFNRDHRDRVTGFLSEKMLS